MSGPASLPWATLCLMDSADGRFEKQLPFKWFSSSDGKEIMKPSQQSEQVGSQISKSGWVCFDSA